MIIDKRIAMRGTPSFISRHEINVAPWQAPVLRARERAGHSIYVYTLGILESRVNILRNDREYMALARKKDKTEEDKDKLKEIQKEKGFTRNDANKLANSCRHHFRNRKRFRHGTRNGCSIESPIAQNLGSRAFRAAEKLLYGKAGKLNYHRINDPIMLEGKDNSHAIMLKGNIVCWGGLEMPLMPVDPDDEYMMATFFAPIKYCGIRRERIRGRDRWFLYAVHEGIPPMDKKKHPDILGEGRIGLDIGTSTLAECSRASVRLHELNPSYHDGSAEKRRLQRKMDRSRRANNPQNYNEDGTIRRLRKGEKREWKNSGTYMRTRDRLRDSERKARVRRQQEQNILAKEIISHGNGIIAEKMGFSGLQKRTKETTINRRTGRYNRKSRFGKAIANRAPSGQIEAINRKLGYFGLAVMMADTAGVKASQFCHLTGKCVKKQLYERWNDFDGRKVQRDLYSAFLLMNLGASLDAVDIERCGRTYEEFLLLHDEEVERIRALPRGNILHWYVK